MDKHLEQPGQYEAPSVRIVGSVYSLTGTNDKKFNATDGLTFMGIPIGNNSP
jgi:hypothetical protein